MTLPLLTSQTGKILIESHRGCESLAPENSWTGLELALARRADLIEVDVQLSADGVAFLRHNYYLPDGQRAGALPWAELSQVRILAEALPRLDETLDWARRSGACLALDLKCGFSPAFALGDAVLRLVQAAGLEERVLLLAWDHHEIRRIKQACPAVATRALLRARPVDLPGLLRACACDCISLSYDLLRPGDVSLAHDLGVAVSLGDLFVPDFAFARACRADIVSWGDPLEARLALEQL